MNRCTGTNAFKRWAISAALLVHGAGLAAASKQEPLQQEQDEELDEVLVEGHKPVKDPQKGIDWLARLAGEFVIDGEVDLHGRRNPEDLRKAQGRGTCIGFGVAPAVQCELKIRWPETRGPEGQEMLGGVSTLDPAMMLFGFDPDRFAINQLLVDSKGNAEGWLGYLITEDTLVSRRECLNIPGQCERVVRITADPDLKAVEMKIELEIDHKKAVSFLFVMHRVPGSPSVVFGREK